jgi:hypothetical protein
MHHLENSGGMTLRATLKIKDDFASSICLKIDVSLCLPLVSPFAHPCSNKCINH